MNDTFYHYVDAGFNHEQANRYTLLLLAGDSNFTFAITEQQKLMAWSKPQPLTTLKQPDAINGILHLNYQQIIAGLPGYDFTLVPEALYRDNSIAQIARYLDVKADDKVIAQPLDTENRIIFKITPKVSEALAPIELSKAIFNATGWIQAVGRHQPSGYDLYLNINESRFDILYYRQGKLMLYNNFEITHEDELAYYTLFAVQQLNLDPATLTVNLSGAIASGDNRYQNRLAEFFKTVILNTLTVVDFPAQLPAHQLLPVTALSLCVSLVEG